MVFQQRDKHMLRQIKLLGETHFASLTPTFKIKGVTVSGLNTQGFIHSRTTFLNITSPIKYFSQIPEWNNKAAWSHLLITHRDTLLILTRTVT